MYYDAIACCEIDPGEQVALRAGKTVNYCHIATLAHWYKTGNTTDPFTRQPFNSELILRLEQYLAKHRSIVTINFECTAVIPDTTSIGMLIMDAFTITNSLKMIRELDVRLGNDSLYARDLDTSISTLSKNLEIVYTRPTSNVYLRKYLGWLSTCTDPRAATVRELITQELHHGRD